MTAAAFTTMMSTATFAIARGGRVGGSCGSCGSCGSGGIGVRRGAMGKATTVGGSRTQHRRVLAPPVRALPETSEIAEQGVEGYVATLEQAYGDEDLGNEVRDRMVEDRQFSIGIRQAMADPKYTDRLRAAIDASPYMQAAVNEAQRRMAEKDVTQQVMGDDSIQGQLAEMSNNPEVLRQTQEQSEELLKKVAGELVDGVKEYRDEFEPNADDLIDKFGQIAENGYESFLKISMTDVNVKNAIINALYDEMEEAQQQNATGGGGERG